MDLFRNIIARKNPTSSNKKNNVRKFVIRSSHQSYSQLIARARIQRACFSVWCPPNMYDYVFIVSTYSEKKALKRSQTFRPRKAKRSFRPFVHFQELPHDTYFFGSDVDLFVCELKKQGYISMSNSKYLTQIKKYMPRIQEPDNPLLKISMSEIIDGTFEADKGENKQKPISLEVPQEPFFEEDCHKKIRFLDQDSPDGIPFLDQLGIQSNECLISFDHGKYD